MKSESKKILMMKGFETLRLGNFAMMSNNDIYKRMDIYEKQNETIKILEDLFTSIIDEKE